MLGSAWKGLEKPGKYTVASMLSVASLTLIFMCVHNKVRFFLLIVFQLREFIVTG